MTVAIDTEHVLKDLVFWATDNVQVRTDGTVYEIAHVKPVRTTSEYTHVAVSLGRYGTLVALYRALVSKVGLLYQPGIETARIADFFEVLLQIERNVMQAAEDITAARAAAGVDAAVAAKPLEVLTATSVSTARAKTLVQTVEAPPAQSVKKVRAQKR